MIKMSQKNFFCGAVTLTVIALAGAPASAWKPSKEVELIAHEKTSTSTYGFASAVLAAIKEEKLLPKGVSLRSISGVREGTARAFVGVKNKGNRYIMLALSP